MNVTSDMSSQILAYAGPRHSRKVRSAFPCSQVLFWLYIIMYNEYKKKDDVSVMYRMIHGDVVNHTYNKLTQ